MKRLYLLLLIVTWCLPVLAADDPVVAKIGDKKILLSDFNRWVSYSPEEARKRIATDPKQKDMLLRSIVTGMVIADLSREQGFDKRPDIKENMELLDNNFLTVQYLYNVVAKAEAGYYHQVPADCQRTPGGALTTAALPSPAMNIPAGDVLNF